LEDVALNEGTLLKIENHDGVLQMTPVDVEVSRQMEAFLRTEKQHQRSYQELAK
jgi:hypothetical protein